MKTQKIKYSKKITSRARTITKQEDIWITLCDKNNRDCWIQWKKTGRYKETPIFHSCDKYSGTDTQSFDTIEKAIEWEKNYT